MFSLRPAHPSSNPRSRESPAAAGDTVSVWHRTDAPVSDAGPNREGSQGGAVPLDEKGNVKMTVKEWNDSVSADAAKTGGSRLAGLDGTDPQ